MTATPDHPSPDVAALAAPQWWAGAEPAGRPAVVRAIGGPFLAMAITVVGWVLTGDGGGDSPWLVAVLAQGVLVASYIWVCRWLTYACGVAQRRSPLLRTVQPWHVWAFWWFPLAGLWLPYVLVRATARSTAPGRGVRVLVALWWVCFVLGLHRYVALPRMSPPVHVVATVLAALAWSRIVVVIQRSQTVTAAPSTVES